MMEDECLYSEEELLAIHAETERLDQRWRIWGVRVAVGVSLALLAAVITATGAILSAVYGSGGPGYNIYDRLWAGGFIGLLVMTGISLGLAIPRAVVRFHLWRLCGQHLVKDLPPVPPPQPGEQFGRDRVLLVSKDELHLASPPLARVEGIWRLICLITLLVMASIATAISAVSNPIAGLVCGVLSTIFVAAIGWTLIPLSTQWKVVTDERGSHLDIQMVRWFLLRGAAEIAPEDINAFSLKESELQLRYHGSRNMRLTEIGIGMLARWKARRLVAAICERLHLSEMVVEECE